MNEKEIFLKAIQITDECERANWVLLICSGDETLRLRVEELLEDYAKRGGSQLPNASPLQGADKDALLYATKMGGNSQSEYTPGEEVFRRYLQRSARPGSLGRLAHYEIESILGRGAFGIVAKAFDEKLHRVVAIKLMDPSLAATSPPRKRFIREARSIAAVSHENIVDIYTVEQDPIPYLVMEYIPGQTLQQLLDAKGPIEVESILRIGQQIASGLAAAHKANLIHRDIKPSNILLCQDPLKGLRITDFGLARAADDASMTSSGTIAGTPLYMAPEQARGETVDHRADLFSLGSILYQMASGRPPFRASNTLAVLKRVCEDRPRSLDDILPGIPTYLESIIFKLLEKNREDRFQTAKEVSELFAFHLSELRNNEETSHVVQPLPSKKVSAFETPGARGIWRKKRAMLTILGCVVATLVPVGLLAVNLLKTSKVRDHSASSMTDSLSHDRSLAAPEQFEKDRNGGQGGSPKPAIVGMDASQAERCQQEWADYLNVPVEFENSIGMRFRLIPPGEFVRGSTPQQVDEFLKTIHPDNVNWLETVKGEVPVHEVRIMHPIYLAIHEVSQKQYERIMGGNPSHFSSNGKGKDAVAGLQTDNHPVEMISWINTIEFCEELTRREKLTPCYFRSGESITPINGTGYRLPTEAEWEYACRAGTTTTFWTGDDDSQLHRAGWFGGNSGGRTHASGELAANPFGLYDMYGNVCEWVEDGWDAAFYRQFEGKKAIDPKCPFGDKPERVIRGGGWWFDPPSRCRSSYRSWSYWYWPNNVHGFRVVRIIDGSRNPRALPR